jgi:LEA14-like dessication related protein
MKKILLSLIVGSVILSSCGTAKIQQPEYREIRQVRLIELGLLQSTAGIDLVYYNPNNFGVQLSEARGDVYIDNSYLGRFELGEKVQVGRNSEFVVPAIIKLDMIGAIKNQRDLFQKKEALVRIEGVARVKKSGISREVPLRYESMQNIERFRVLVSK